MKRLLAALVVVLVVGAGCQAPTTSAGTTVASNATTTAPTATPTSTGTTTVETTPAVTTEPTNRTQDRIGFENGYAYDATLSINESDGLNGTELDAVVARSMARVEHVRQLEFNTTVPVEVITRSELRNRSTFNASSSSTTRSYQDTQWRALFLIGDDTDSTSARQNTTQNTVLGYYSPRSESIVIVSGSETPELSSERTLAHELVHALQDQQFAIRSNASTSDGTLASRALAEGDATFVEKQYMSACDEEWSCLGEDGDASSGSGSASAPSNWGFYLASIFPYYDGTKFVRETKQDGGWEAVNDLYDARPNSTEQVISPEKYERDSPRRVSLSDTSSPEWSITGPQGRHTSDTMGQALIATMFLHTLYDDYNRSAAVSRLDAFHYDGRRLNSTDPLNHDLDAVDGWAGDRMYVYTNGTRTGYVWKIAFDDAEDAEEFESAYSDLLAHWGGSSAGGSTYTIPEESPYTGAYSVVVDDDEVTITGAPSQRDLGEIRSGA